MASLVQCYIFLDEAEGTAQILEKLSRGTHDDLLVAYQIAFDLYESATQHFLSRVSESIKAVLPVPVPRPLEEQPAVQSNNGQEEDSAEVTADNSEEKIENTDQAK